MSWKIAPWVALTIINLGASASGQLPANPNTADEIRANCREYDRTELVFLGRADPPITYRISGEAEIEIARQNLARVEDEVARLTASLDVKTRFERAAEFALKIIEARTQLDIRR